MIWDLENEVRGSAPVVCVAAVGFASVGVFGIVCVDIGDLAVIFGGGGALFAVGFQAGGGLGADAYAITDSCSDELLSGKGEIVGDRLDIAFSFTTNLDGVTDDFMSSGHISYTIVLSCTWRLTQRSKDNSWVPSHYAACADQNHRYRNG